MIKLWKVFVRYSQWQEQLWPLQAFLLRPLAISYIKSTLCLKRKHVWKCFRASKPRAHAWTLLKEKIIVSRWPKLRTYLPRPTQFKNSNMSKRLKRWPIKSKSLLCNSSESLARVSFQSKSPGDSKIVEGASPNLSPIYCGLNFT